MFPVFLETGFFFVDFVEAAVRLALGDALDFAVPLPFDLVLLFDATFDRDPTALPADLARCGEASFSKTATAACAAAKRAMGTR